MAPSSKIHPILTYSLRGSRPDSDEFYRTLSAFTGSTIESIKLAHAPLIAGFRQYLEECGKPVRSQDELAFELLALGVFLREYGPESGRFPIWSSVLLNQLIALPDHWPASKALSKKLRGWLYGLYSLIPGKTQPGNKVQELITWLDAEGEQVKTGRFMQWQDYLMRVRQMSAQEITGFCLALAGDFERTSLATLGVYTDSVPRFLSTTAREHRWKYDAALVSKSRLEYHLGMLGTELLNRAFRNRFLATERKVVILPPCMSAPEHKCKAIETDFGARCSACTPACRVNQITKLGEKYGFEVFLIPDDMQVFKKSSGKGRLGLVGVSCTLTNWNGGWEAASLGIPAQGVLLDYVGCIFHWDRKGFPTDTNMKRLQAVLGIQTKP